MIPKVRSPPAVIPYISTHGMLCSNQNAWSKLALYNFLSLQREALELTQQSWGEGSVHSGQVTTLSQG